MSNIDYTDDIFKLTKDRIHQKLSPNGPLSTWEKTGPFCFVQLADTQFGMLEQTFDGQWLRKYRKLINILYMICPAFVIVCGDLVNAMPHKEPTKFLKTFKKIFSKVHPDIALVCCCGNHDVGNRPTPKTIKTWSNNFGSDYFSFIVGGVKCIVLNSQLYKDPSSALDLAAEQDTWLDSELAHTHLIFSHHPPFINDPYENDEYFPLDRITRLRLLHKLCRAGATHWFSGHYHRNGGIYYETKCGESNRSKKTVETTPNRTPKTLEVCVTAAVGANIISDSSGDILGLSGMKALVADTKTSGIRVVKVHEKTISHKYYSLFECSKKINEANDGIWQINL
eukprot:GSMAST32.ASY1.ANO1.1898.1 assembled CDS